MKTEELKQKAMAIRIPHYWWSESVSEAIPVVLYRAGDSEWPAVVTQEIPKCAIPADCDKYTFNALERARISDYVAAANPATVLALIDERDELLTALRRIGELSYDSQAMRVAWEVITKVEG